ncbi:T9SS type A sorting domain-containing protein [Polaribacter sp. PL03]|uniref:T9SS type A sorting domain-containing protein n=1 Tax=Polaribacter sp. PL03 TaxID=3088353 RepID=UPI0029CB2E38|nr:T9SS type A sorting domain-containing protein [Polaribacter sp. PL03]MDX6748098.1 T9SS type A sorting domain-containing protein [Polaribacter sp. PL03]
MKTKNIITQFLIFFTLIINAQTIYFEDENRSLNSMYVNSNDMYFTETRSIGNTLYENQISRISLRIENPIITTFVPWYMPFNYEFDRVLDENNIYISEEGSISKIDLSSSSPVKIKIFEKENFFPQELVINQNILYISDPNSRQIYKLNLSVQSPSLDVVAQLVNKEAREMIIHRNNLYFNDGLSSNIYKIDITTGSATQTPTGMAETTQVTNNNGNSFSINGNDLYFIRDFIIYKINLESNLPVSPVEVLNGYHTSSIVCYENNLFFSAPKTDGNNNSFGVIYKLDISTILSTNNLTLKDKIAIYPNPTNQFITFNGLNETTNYYIFNSLGKEIQKGKIPNKGKINLESLEKGIYIIKFENGKTTKFIKK